jgi:hypothetical protein
MSYDSILQLREARTVVGGGNFPTLPSYIWIPFDKLWPGPALMLTFQNGLFLLSAAHLLVRVARWSAGVIAALVVGIGLLPPLIGPMLVVWKDIGMMAFFTATAALLAHAETTDHKASFRIALGSAFVCMFLGSAYRLNAFPAVLPFIVWMVRLGWPAARAAARWMIAGFLMVALLGGVVALSTWRLPTFERLPPARVQIKCMVFDLYGMSHITREILIPPEYYAAYPDYSIRDVDAVYNPEHVDYVFFGVASNAEARLLDVGIKKIATIPQAWWKAVADHPVAYLRHRLRVFAELISLHGRPVFYPTHPAVDPNDLGVTHQPTKLTSGILSYLFGATRLVIVRPWICYALALVGAGILLRRRPAGAHVPLFLAASAMLYIGPFLVIGIAADLRFNCWAVAASVLALISMVAVLVPSKQQPGVSIRCDKVG